MKKHSSIDALAAATAHRTQNQTAMIQRDLRALRDSVSGLTRGIKAPVIRPPRTRIKGSRSGGNLLGFIGIGASQLIDTGIFGDNGISIGGKVKFGSATFSSNASQTDSGYDDGSSNSSSFYTSDAQSASAQSNLLSLGQRIR